MQAVMNSHHWRCAQLSATNEAVRCAAKRAPLYIWADVVQQQSLVRWTQQAVVLCHWVLPWRAEATAASWPGRGDQCRAGCHMLQDAVTPPGSSAGWRAVPCAGKCSGTTLLRQYPGLGMSLCTKQGGSICSLFPQRIIHDVGPQDVHAVIVTVVPPADIDDTSDKSLSSTLEASTGAREITATRAQTQCTAMQEDDGKLTLAHAQGNPAGTHEVMADVAVS